MREFVLVVLTGLVMFLGFLSIASVSQSVFFGVPSTGGTMSSPNMDSVTQVSGKFLIAPTRPTTLANKSSIEVAEDSARALAMVVTEFGSPLTVSTGIVPFAISDVGVDPYRDSSVSVVESKRSVFFLSSMPVPLGGWSDRQTFSVTDVGSSFTYHGYAFVVVDRSGDRWLFQVNGVYFAVVEGFPSYFYDPDANIYIRAVLRNGRVTLAGRGG